MGHCALLQKPTTLCLCLPAASCILQTCFLSSVDIHTQCGYQTMLEEAVAIVMAPTDSKKKCGIFRLTTPEGLTHVQRCNYRGFHHQCSSVHYELCGHVYLNPNAKHEVIDLRS